MAGAHGGFGGGRGDCGACQGVGRDGAGVGGAALVAAQAEEARGGAEEARHEALGLVPLLDHLVVDQHLKRRCGLQRITRAPQLTHTIFVPGAWYIIERAI